MKSKRQVAVEQLEAVITALRCPICQSALEVTETGATCPHRHTIDVAKQGYLHLAGTVTKSRYTKELFIARQTLLKETKFFEPLIDEIVKWIREEVTEPSLRIVDMGCGEGTHLSGIVRQLPGSHGIGIDLAKDGVQLATNHGADVLWLVADLAKSPLQDHSIDIVLNILSPANHTEFRRVLTPSGYVIKVIPNARYLQELRSFFYAGTEKETFENEEAGERFASELEVVGISQVTYTKNLTEKQWRDLIAMTPLTWNAPADQVDAFIERGESEVTIDLTVLIGRVKEK
ncbi:putative RNA methyltransferase [Chryseomicrobium palamuruense]|uniref:RNA methyltransferase n=1 Tax=Chryseomicrobium palamuruense TaxID=682973 RepID=A0ABV8URM8_9BACL